MTAYEPPVKDYDFLLRNVIATDEVLSAVTAGDVSVDDAMDVVEGASSVVRPIAELSAIGDRIGSRLKDGTVVTPPGFREAFASYAEGGWIGLAAPESIGGAGMPRTIAIASDEFLSDANTAFAMAPQLNSYALAVFAAVNDSALNAIYVPAMIAGRWTATMELTDDQEADLHHHRMRCPGRWLVRVGPIDVSGRRPGRRARDGHGVLASTSRVPDDGHRLDIGRARGRPFDRAGCISPGSFGYSVSITMRDHRCRT